ncbi:hypothetical protein D3C71_1799720 [compost metagenome]
MVPIGVSRMTHQRILRTMTSSDWLKARNGLAASPAFSAAAPKTIETTRICSTLKFSEVLALPSVSLVLASRPNMLAGTRPLRKSSHEPE